MEKWEPVFPRDKRRGVCAEIMFKQKMDDEHDSTQLKHALGPQLVGHQFALRRKATPFGGPADALLTPRPLQREWSALRVLASDDPGATGQFKRTCKYPAAGAPHALRGFVDIADIEIIKPERNRLR